MSISFSAEGARSHTPALVRGMRDGVPIGLGYLAVAFSLGIAARNAGLNAFQGFLVSLLNNASAGEYAGFTTIAADASYLEIAVVTLIANARYLLMSCSLSQKFAPGTPMRHRLLVGYDVTDELFGLAISCDGWLDPYYMYGAILVAAPSWAVGTALGVVVGNLLPARVVSALSVALFGMFLAIIIPPSKKNPVVLGCVCVSFAASWLCSVLPLTSGLSEGTRTILLTILIASAAAAVRKVTSAHGRPPSISACASGTASAASLMAITGTMPIRESCSIISILCFLLQSILNVFMRFAARRRQRAA